MELNPGAKRTLLAALSELVYAANQANQNDNSHPGGPGIMEARRFICMTIGVQRNDEPPSVIEAKLTLALAPAAAIRGDEIPAWLAYAGVPLDRIPEPLRAGVQLHREGA
jgi:hypothetical protein